MSRLRMTNRPFQVAALVALCLSVAQGQSDSHASHTASPSREGEITSNDVYVRSGPSLNHYTILKLKAGDRVTILGETGDWFEIAPPDGSFSLISGDYVDRAAGAAQGVVNGNRVRVRAGSQLNDNKYTVQEMLDKGAEVTIVGSNPDGFLRIVPPNGATLWISKTFVATVPDGRATGADLSGAPNAQQAAREYRVESPSDQNERASEAIESDIESNSRPESSAVESNPNEKTAASAFEGATLTPARRTLDEIDADAYAEMRRPMNERRLEPLMARYEAVANDERDVLAAQYAQERIRQLRDVQSIIETVRTMRQVSDESETARQEFLQQRAAIPTVIPPAPSALDAQGTLRESALYSPDREPRRYRLVNESVTPPRTIAYVDIPSGFTQPVERYLDHRIGLRAVSKSWQQGGVEPIRIYTAGEFVLMDSSDEYSDDQDLLEPSTTGNDVTKVQDGTGSDN